MKKKNCISYLFISIKKIYCISMDYGGIFFPKNKKNIHNDPLTGKTLLLLNLKKKKNKTKNQFESHLYKKEKKFIDILVGS